ncbi:MAG: SEL1-like repeat protein [Caulobacteraceae bacterium]|nr:SEL1-like repeat protein [Caulobacteraceae bacterium]
MSAGAPWSVKGIDPKAREAAKDLARRSGMTLGEWLNRMILEEDGPEEVSSQSFFDRPARPAAGSEPAIKRYEAPEHPADDMGRVAGAMDDLARRIEVAEARAAEAIREVDGRVRAALSRIDSAERDKVAVASRFEGLADEIGGGHARLVDRVQKLEREAQGPRSVEALRSLEAALGKVANHLYEADSRSRQRMADVEVKLERVADPATLQGMIDQVVAEAGERLGMAEGRTAETLASLQDSFAALDARLSPIERTDPAGRLEQLAASLTQRMETARVQMAEQLRAAADGRFERVERKLGELGDHVSRAERASAEAIAKMGHEVVQVADSLTRRMGEVETRGAQAVQQVSGELARVSATVDQRLAQAERTQAEALARLSGEVGKITERLSERIGAAERRSASAVDDVAEQVARITERFNQRQERTSDDLAERIRQSEERTARLLDEARERIDRRLAEQVRREPEMPTGWPSNAPPARDLGPDLLAELSPEPLGDDPFGRGRDDDLFGTPFGRGGAGAQAFRRDDLDPVIAEDLEDARGGFDSTDEFLTEGGESPEPAFAEPASVEAPAIEDPSPILEEADEPDPPLAEAADDAAASDAVAPAREEPPATVDEPASFEPVSAPEPAKIEAATDDDPGPFARPLTTREIIEQARASARAASTETASPSLLAGISNGKRTARGGMPSVQTAALVFVGGAALGLGAIGYLMQDGGQGLPSRVAEQIAMGRDSREIKGGEVDPAAKAAAPRLAVALAPRPAASPGDAAAAPAQTATVDNTALYGQAVRLIEAGDPKGVETLRRVANLGHAPAQFYLAKLYEGGDRGVKRDMAEARRWTERAAQGGERKAMHNLALYYFEGTGGPKNATVASQWFRKAADLGLVDSQHNLGRLYEEGFGVPQNAAEAYKWYLIAARSGDSESRAAAQRVRPQLSAQAQSTAERSANAYRAAGTAPVQLAAGGPSTATAQQALARLGYYKGPADGTSSPALRLAVAAYQRDQGLAATGALDAATVSRLSVYTR